MSASSETSSTVKGWNCGCQMQDGVLTSCPEHTRVQEGDGVRQFYVCTDGETFIDRGDLRIHLVECRSRGSRSERSLRHGLIWATGH